MTTAILNSIISYPIKSTKGVSLDSAIVKETGIEFDRHFVITDLTGKFITGRTKSSLVLVASELTATGLILTAPGMPKLTISYANFSDNYQQVIVWNDEISSQHCSSDIDQWFSIFLNCSCKVYYLGESSHRQVANYNQKLSFADGYPLLLISEASLNSLNQKLANPVSMAQFRPNLVVSQCTEFAEDGWRKIRIGEVEFEITKPCSRCIFTTVNDLTGERDSSREPLSTLKKFRQAENDEICFGQNLIALNEGVINIGDNIEILQKQTAVQYPVLNI